LASNNEGEGSRFQNDQIGWGKIGRQHAFSSSENSRYDASPVAVLPRRHRCGFQDHPAFLFVQSSASLGSHFRDRAQIDPLLFISSFRAGYGHNSVGSVRVPTLPRVLPAQSRIVQGEVHLRSACLPATVAMPHQGLCASGSVFHAISPGATCDRTAPTARAAVPVRARHSSAHSRSFRCFPIIEELIHPCCHNQGILESSVCLCRFPRQVN